MGRPRSETPKQHTSITTRLLPNGWRYVYEVISVYDPKIKNSRKISSKLVGKLPPGETDVSKRVPTTPNKKKNSNEQAQSDISKAVSNALETVKDARRQECVTYPLDAVLLVIILASVAGFTSNYEIAEYWKSNRAVLAKWIRNFPQRDISHDTVRRIIKLLGQQDAAKLIEQFTEPLMDQVSQRVIAVDGQGVRAAKDKGSPMGKYFISAFEAESEVCLTQEFVDVKHNEITYASTLIESINVEGAVVTCDALNTQTNFAKTVINKGADYCFALKKNQRGLFKLVEAWFRQKSVQDLVKDQQSLDLGHGRIETRSVRVLPGKLLAPLNADQLQKWIGLEQGCLVETTTTIENKTSGEVSSQTRYFISSLCFDSQYIAQRLLRVIRSHWSIENKLHWVLDVTFNQDRTQCKNVDFLKGQIALTKVAFNLMSKIQTMEEEETGKTATSKRALQARFSNPEATLMAFGKLFSRKQK